MRKVVVFLLCMILLLSGCGAAVATPAVNEPTVAVVEPSQTTAAEPTAGPVSDRATVEYPAENPIIRMSYDPELVGKTVWTLVDAVTKDPETMPLFTYPAHIEVEMPEFAQSALSQLPCPMEAAQVKIYQTRDFAGYADDPLLSYTGQRKELKATLAQGIEPGRCLRHLDGTYQYQALPFLPLINAAQVLCAASEIIPFGGGRGIRYITHYSQGLDPVLEGTLFYTFQGVSDDGEYYVSAVMPLRTYVFPTDATGAGLAEDPATRATLLNEQVRQLNAQAPDAFNPTLAALDAFIAGIEVPAK